EAGVSGASSEGRVPEVVASVATIARQVGHWSRWRSAPRRASAARLPSTNARSSASLGQVMRVIDGTLASMSSPTIAELVRVARDAWPGIEVPDAEFEAL